MLSDDIVFIRTLSFDLMKLNQRSVLHALDRDTKFSAACFLNDESTFQARQAFLCIWVTTYVGFPEILALDQDAQFCSDEQCSLAQGSGISLHHSGVERHNAIGNGERYHSYLRRVFHKVQSNTPNLSDEIALTLAVKACNDTAGPKGLVPTLLLFSVLLRV